MKKSISIIVIVFILLLTHQILVLTNNFFPSKVFAEFEPGLPEPPQGEQVVPADDFPINGVGPENSAPGPNSIPAVTQGGVQGIYDKDTGIFYPSGERPDPPLPPLPPAPYCGDNACNNGETCSTCSGDCGSCPQLPDLASEEKDITFSPTTVSAGEIMTFRAIGHNISQVKSGTTFGRFCIDSSNQQCWADYRPLGALVVQNEIQPGGSQSYNSANWFAESGTHTITFCNNKTNTIQESDYTNNCATKQFVIDPPPACDSACTTNLDCAGEINGCTNCVANKCQATAACGAKCNGNIHCENAKDGCISCNLSTLRCEKPAACGTTCNQNSDCAGAKDGCTSCDPTTKKCEEPPACNSACSKDADCAGARDGCVNCNETTKKCEPPPACNSSCTQNSDCAGARDGCVSCNNTTKKCETPPPACNSSCSNDAQCAAATDGCTSCNPNTRKCEQPPACNSACSRDSDCAGAKDGCVDCNETTNKCQTPPSCNSACSKDSDCVGARDGCVDCNETTNKCQTPAACGSSCTKSADCAGARDGCIECNGGVCKKPAACNSACSRDSDCAGAKDGCVDCNETTNKCQTPPSCNSSCSKDSDCAGAKDGCVDCNETTNKCQTPPSCGTACSKASDCAGAKNGCVFCNDQTGKCQVPPACNVACSKDAECAGAKDGCTNCIGGTCSDFNDAMCKCDGIDIGQIASGQEIDVTNYEKVEGGDIRKAMVRDMTFFLTEGNTIIAESQPIAATIDSQTNTKVRYKANWKVKIPGNVKSGVQYRIFAEVSCVKKSAAAQFLQTESLRSAESTRPVSFFGRIANFFKSLFSAGNTATPTPTVKPTPTIKLQSNSEGDNLQLGTFRPMTVTEKSCRIAKFKFN